MGQPVSSAHSNTGSCDWLESSTENSDWPAQKSVVSPGHDHSETCCSLASTDNSTAVSSHSSASKKLMKLYRGSSIVLQDITWNLESIIHNAASQHLLCDLMCIYSIRMWIFVVYILMRIFLMLAWYNTGVPKLWTGLPATFSDDKFLFYKILE